MNNRINYIKGIDSCMVRLQEKGFPFVRQIWKPDRETLAKLWCSYNGKYIEFRGSIREAWLQILAFESAIYLNKKG